MQAAMMPTPDEKRNEARERGGSWATGYNDPVGLNTALLEWFENRIREPVERIDDSVAELGRKLDRHLEWAESENKKVHDEIVAHVKDDHLGWVKQRRTVEKWVVRGIATLVPIVLGLVAQLSGNGF